MRLQKSRLLDAEGDKTGTQGDSGTVVPYRSDKGQMKSAEQKLRLLVEKKKFVKLLNDKPKKKQAGSKEPVRQTKKNADEKPKNKTASRKK